MKQTENIARNYAQALLELASKDTQDSVLNELKTLIEGISQIKEAWRFFENPGVSKENKKKIIESLKPKVSQTTFNFLNLLIDKNRFGILPDIQNQFNKLVNKSKGIVTAEVYSAIELDANTLEEIRHNLEKTLEQNEKVTVESNIEPSLIGGLKVKVNDLVYDGSIKGRLENLKRRIG